MIDFLKAKTASNYAQFMTCQMGMIIGAKEGTWMGYLAAFVFLGFFVATVLDYWINRKAARG